METEWGINNSKRLVDNASVRSMFEFIENYAALGVSVIYRTVATYDELRYYLSQMPKEMYSEYDIIYLAFHGLKGKIQLHEAKDKNTIARFVSLEELGEMCDEGWLSDKHVLFGTCLTMAASEKRVRDFMDKSGAKFVAGYSKTVEFARSSILDIALITEILMPKPKNKTLEERMASRYSGLMEELGMRIYHR